MVLFGQTVVLRQTWLYSGKSCCILAKVVVFGQSGFIPEKVVKFGQKWLYLSKSLYFSKKFFSSTTVVLEQKLLYSG